MVLSETLELTMTAVDQLALFLATVDRDLWKGKNQPYLAHLLPQENSSDFNLTSGLTKKWGELSTPTATRLIIDSTNVRIISP